MTAPLGTGYPDFGRLASEAQVLEINDINVPIAHNFAYPAKYVGNAKSLQLWANPPTHGMRLQFQFYGDPGHAIIMDSYVVNLQPGDVVKQPIPILGPWLFVVVQHSDAATNTVTIQLWRTPEMARFAGLEGDIALFTDVGTAIGAGATITRDHLYVMEGHTNWTAFSGSTNWQVLISAVDFHGTTTPLDLAIGAANGLVMGSTYLPPWHIRAAATNFGAASSFTFLMTRRHNT